MIPFKDWLSSLASKVTPVDADFMYLLDSSGTPSSKYLSWANLKATLATWLNGGTFPITATTLTAGRVTVTSSTLPTYGLYAPAAGVQVGISVGGAPAIRFDSSGHTGAGTSPVVNVVDYVLRGLAPDGTTPDTYGYLVVLTATPVAGAASMRGLHTSLGTAGLVTLPNLYHMTASQGSIVAPVTNQYGYFVDPNMIGGTNNYAFVGAIPSGTNRWNNYNLGTANNAFLGNTSLGKLTVPTCAMDTTSEATSIVTNAAATYVLDSIVANSVVIQTAGASTYTLPTAANFTGRRLRVLTQSANAVISNASNVVPLAGGAAGTAIVSNVAGKWADLQAVGTTWQITAAN